MADKNPYPGEDITHVWDDNISELNNPPPRWWMITFYLSIIAVIVYGLLYPMIPFFGEKGHSEGLLGWTQMKEYREDLAEVQQVRAKYETQIMDMEPQAILADRELTNYTLASAKVLFGDYCSGCHGAGGQGNIGYPVLADDDWLYGGSVETIIQTLINGRKGLMTPHVGTLSEQEIDALANYVLTLSEGGEDAEGKALYTTKGCIACHGPEGKGNPALGSANLTDSIWRFEPGGFESARYTIMHGVNFPSDPKTRSAVMPSFNDRLDELEIKKLAVFVHQLGGGQ